jgi:hypothetical protein
VATPDKQLICPQCGQMMAMASWQLLRGLRMTAPDGSPLTPVSNDLMLRSTEQRLASASEQDQPTAPQISAAIRRTPGNWVAPT